MKTGRILAFGVLALAAGGGWYYWTHLAATNPDSPRPRGRRAARTSDAPVAVTVAPVKVEIVPVFREGIGNVQAFALVTVRSQIDGLLTAIEFREGQEVRKGDVLARIDPASLRAQLDQAQAKKAQDAANLANARLDLERYQRLAATNAGPRQQADQQKAVVAQLEAQVRADEAAISSATTNLAYTVIASPIDGRAGLRQVDAGNIIRASDAAGLVTIARITPISALFTLPQRDLQAVSAALARGEVPVEALDTDGRTVLATGSLQVVDNQVDMTTGTIKLKALFPNEDRKLWPGQFVNVRVKVADLVGARTVPTPALRRGPSGSFVYVVGPDETALVKPVTVTMQDETRAVIRTGLEPGDRVITAGFPRLSEGKKVDAAPEPTAGEGQSAAPPPRQRRSGAGGGQGRGRGNGPAGRSGPIPDAPGSPAPAIPTPVSPAGSPPAGAPPATPGPKP
jgi:membrane fusion protein, multidrug efflux system